MDDALGCLMFFVYIALIVLAIRAGIWLLQQAATWSPL